MIENFIKWILKAFQGWREEENVIFDICVSNAMQNAIYRWSLMYHGNPVWIDESVKSMNIPSVLASELARLVTIEMESKLEGSPRADFINSFYQRLITRIRPMVEMACAKGGICFKPYVTNGKLEIDCVQADCFLPIAYDSDGEICSAAFVSRITRNSRFYTRVERHCYMDDVYEIRNAVYMSESESDIGKKISFELVPEWSELSEVTTIKNLDKPLFSYLKMPFANTVDPYSPLGVSCFSRAVDLIEQADKQYSRLLWEFEGGELAVDASIDALKYDKNHPNGKLPKGKERLFRGLDIDCGDKDLYEVFSPELRDNSIINGLNEILIRIEDACGFARGTISNIDSTSAKTATEIKTSKQRTYALVCDTQKALKHSLTNLIDAINELCDLYNLIPAGEINVSFEFDDSVVTDRELEFKEKQQLVMAGIMQPWEFRAWYFGESEEEAKEKVMQDDLFGNGSEK